MQLKNDYNFSINIATFVEIVQQKINNKQKFYDMIDFLINNNIYINEFKINHCIKVENFTFQKLKIESKKDRKSYFNPIKNNYYDFLCKFISLFLEWILYSLMQLISENLNENIDYKKYLEKMSIQYKREFKKCYDGKKEKVKDKFNSIVYYELKKLNHIKIKTNRVLLNEIIQVFEEHEDEMMKIFHAESREARNIRKRFIDDFFIREIKPFLDSRFKNIIFESYVKDIFEKLIERGGKLDGNDIADSLIICNVGQNHILLTNDKKIIKFLKSKNLYEERVYSMFKI